MMMVVVNVLAGMKSTLVTEDEPDDMTVSDCAILSTAVTSGTDSDITRRQSARDIRRRHTLLPRMSIISPLLSRWPLTRKSQGIAKWSQTMMMMMMMMMHVLTHMLSCYISSTQPGHPFTGRDNEYRSVGGDAAQLGSKARYDSCLVTGKTV